MSRFSLKSTLRQRRTRGLFLLAILFLAAGLRFWDLGMLPPGLYHDEAYNGLDALSLLNGAGFPQFYEGWELYALEAHNGQLPEPSDWPIFFEGNYGREPLHVYLMAVSIRLFGATPFAVRAVPAAAGVLAVFTTYLAAVALWELRNWRSEIEARQLTLTGRETPFPHFVPLVAAFAMAILYPALTFSRFGIRAMLFVPLETLCIYCFWRGIHAGTPAGWIRGRTTVGETGWFVAAGLFLGLGLYTYASSRLLPLLFVLFIPLWLWQDKRARDRWRQLVWMGVTAVVVAAPLLIFFARYQYYFLFRTAYVANRGAGTVPGKPWLTWLTNTGRVVAGLFWHGETHLRHNLPGRPYLDPIQSLFFLSGLAALLRRFQLRSLFLLLWLGVMLLATLLSGDAPHFGRMTGATPAVAILIAVGANELWCFLVGSRERRTATASRGRLLVTLLMSGLALISLTLTVRDYFGRYANHPELADAFYLPDWRLGRYAGAQPPETVIYLTPTQEEMATIYFALQGDLDRLHSYSWSETLIPAGQLEQPLLYLVRPEATAELERLQQYFPGGMVRPVQNEFIPFHVPASSPRITAGYPGGHNWADQIGLVGWSAKQTGDELVVSLIWQTLENLSRDYTAYVHILDEAGQLVAQLDRPPDGYPTGDWRPGELIIDRYHISLPAGLPSGTYTLHSGFYDGPTLEPLDDPAVLGSMELPLP